MANKIAFFAVKSVGLSRLNGRKPCSLKDAARHNFREIQSESGARGSINPMQTDKNWVLAGPTNSDSVLSLAEKIASSAGVDLRLKRHDYCQAIEIIFSLPDKSLAQPQKYFQDCLSWAMRAYRLPVLSAVVHLDESSPHCHLLLMPLNNNGEYVGSRPLAKTETKKQIESFFSSVALPAGLTRQNAKLRGLLKQIAINRILERCRENKLSDACGPLWTIFEAEIKKDPVPFLEALGIDREELSSCYKRLISTQSDAITIKRKQQKTIGIDKADKKRQTLSSVGIAKSIGSHKDERVNLHQTNAEKGCCRGDGEKYKKEIALVADAVCLTRVKDEYAHDLSSWDD